MNPELLQQIISAILGARHKWYGRAIDRAIWAKEMVTGEGHKDRVTKYRVLENQDLQDQRFRLYNPLTKYILSRPRKYWQKIGKTPGQNIILESDNKDRLSELNIQFENFADNRNLMDWLVFKAEHLGVTDPNAWIIFDRNDKRGAEGNIIETRIYPWVVRSCDVLNYTHFRGDLQTLTVQETRIVAMNDGKSTAERYLYDYYTFYPGGVVKFREVLKVGEILPGETLQEIALPGQDPRLFGMSVTTNGTKEVPAMCVGAYRDDLTDQETFVTWFDPAEHILEDVIRDKSISDLIRILHAFRKRWEYVKPCDNEDPKMGACRGGFYGGVKQDSHRCTSCGGTGKTQFTTEQQVNQLATPLNSTALLELSKLSFEEPVDITLPTFFDQQVDKDVIRVMNCVFNIGIIEQATGAATATAENYAWEALYDTLTPFEKTISLLWMLAYRIGAQYMEFDIKAVHRFPKDKRMKPLSELFADLTSAKNSGAGYDVQRNIEENIIYKQSEDNQEEVAWMLARYDWLPFADKPENERVAILSTRAGNDPEKVLYENWLSIFQEIEAEDLARLEASTEPDTVPVFYRLTYAEQKKVVMAKVAEVTAKIISIDNGQTFDPEAQPA